MDLLAGYKIRISEIHNFATDALYTFSHSDGDVVGEEVVALAVGDV